MIRGRMPAAARLSVLVCGLLFAGMARGTDFAVSSGSFTAGSSWSGGVAPGPADDANINNGGTATLASTDIANVAQLHLGQAAGQSGRMIMNGGTLGIVLTNGNGGDTAVTIGDAGVGNFTMNDGTLILGGLASEDGDFHVGKNSTTASTMTMNGGQVNMGGTLRIARGQSANAVATLNLAGGEFNTGAGVVVARGNAGSTPVGTFALSGTGKYVAGNSRGEGNLIGYEGEGFFSIANSIGTTGHVTMSDTSVVKARRLTGRQGHGDLTIGDHAQFFVVNHLGSLSPNGTVLYGSFLGGGSQSNGDGSDGGTGLYTLLLKGNGLLDVDANADGRDPGRPELQGFILARGNSTANATIADNATMIVRQRFIIGGLGAVSVNLNGFDGQASGGTNPGGTSTVTMTGGTLSTDQLIVGGSGTGTLNASGGIVETTAFNSTFDPVAGSPSTSVNSIRIGMLQGSTGVMNVSGTVRVSTGEDLGIGQYGNGTLKVTGGGATILANNVYVQKFAGSTGAVIAEITGVDHTPIRAKNSVTINGGTFQVLATAPPASKAHTWNILIADVDADGFGEVTGKFDTLKLPPDDGLGRRWSVIYTPLRVVAGLAVPGDANFDSSVNFTDLVALAQNYGGAGQWPEGDFNGDGTIDFNDLVPLAQHYGTSLPAEPIPGAPAGFEGDLARAFAAAVPEPGAGLVAVLGLTLACVRRPRRERPEKTSEWPRSRERHDLCRRDLSCDLREIQRSWDCCWRG
jgi:T5SS/PEP-CTERM-associated repeat protein